MQLSEVNDPRDVWMKARRQELVRHAHKHGHKDISEDMPATLIRKLLKGRGVPPPSIPPRSLWTGNPREGDTSPESHEYHGGNVQNVQVETIDIDADELAEREWLAQCKQTKLKQSKPVAEMSFNEIRKELKARGVKLSRRDRLGDLRAKLNGKQDTP